MAHVCLVPFVGLRVRDEAMLALGMSLPGLHQRAQSIGHLPALGLLTLAGMLPVDWTCSYHSAAGNDEELVSRVLAEEPALVAVSALTASAREAYAFCDRLRQAGAKVVMGGLHASVQPEEAANHADGVVVGAGEPVWQQVLQDAQQGVLQPVYRSNRLEPLADWPLPRFDLLGHAPPRYTIQTQRGCPWACDFCGASRLLAGFQEKPVDCVRRELATICTLDPHPRIELADDNTFAGSRDADELLDALQASGATWFTESDWRVGQRPALLKRLASAGCRQLLVGMESLVFRYPGMGEKQAEMAEMMEAVMAIQEAGVPVNGCFIVGAEGETQESLDRLTQFLLESPFAELQVTLQTPFPGTALYRRLRREGRLLPERGWEYYTLFDVTYRPDRLSVEELEVGYRNLLAAVFAPQATKKRASLCRRMWQGVAR